MLAKSLADVILLMGPTASGKTALGIELAKSLDAEIISVDSALVYRGMDIGTAKPDTEERQGIKHHLIDIIDPSEVFSAGQFKDRALSLIKEIQEKGKQVILVGGTML
ncbi:MAG: tRNA (adenosine(37)-N6)-dimethylallyltransferase MiaA, partial [Cycloclasticus sp.]|nr:tRNA (adenosine(37)-N6)-dimethylallyltransferase MiaA [Cycloclasticus sp.]